MTLGYRTIADGPQYFRLYGFDGRPSIAALAATLPTGFRAYVSEKLERIPGDPDTNLLEEYYFEDPGFWRIGKQVLPFGLTRVIHETVLAARADTNLILQGVPVSAAVCDGGRGLQQGADLRIGSRIGASLFLGNNFGISSESFTQIREPEGSPGLGRGYQVAMAIDGNRRLGKFEFRGELDHFSQGETGMDPNLTLADGTISYQYDRNTSITAGYTYKSTDSEQFIRFGAAIPITRGVQFEPWIRFKDNALWDISLQVRVRI